MAILTLELCRGAAHTDGLDDDQLQVYMGAAEAAAINFLNRHVYADASEKNTATSMIPQQLADAQAAYDAAIAAAEDEEGLVREMALLAAWTALEDAKLTAWMTMRSIVAVDDIRAAMLLTVGHLYRNREAVVTGQGAAAVELPLGVETMLWPYRIGLGI